MLSKCQGDAYTPAKTAFGSEGKTELSWDTESQGELTPCRASLKELFKDVCQYLES